MPSDIHSLPDKRRYVDARSERELINIVRDRYPDAMASGACGTWAFHVGSELVAEAWIHPRKPGWWLRIKARIDAEGAEVKA